MQQPRLEKRLTDLRDVSFPEWANWLGAVSFGMRSCASLQALERAGRSVSAGSLILYRTKKGADPVTAANRVRNRSTIVGLLRSMSRDEVSEHEMSQYSATPLTQLLFDNCSVAAQRGGRTILDITGLTKFHTVIAAAEAAKLHLEGRLTLAYTIPENYIGFDKKERFSTGFAETLILPLVDGAKMMRESNARGVILPGHEGQRLLVALGEIDPIGGTFIHAVTPRRPDFEQVARHRNRPVHEELTGLGKWRDFSVDFRRMRNVSMIVRNEARRAKANNGPLLIYPFGPKPSIFAAVFTAARLYPEGSWFVYPIPTNSSNQHTEGVTGTYWMNL
jgi:hypothetical protein